MLRRLRTNARTQRRRAAELETRLRIAYPTRDFTRTGPLAEWHKEWVQTGWVADTCEPCLPTSIEGITYARRARVHAGVWADGGRPTLRLRVGTIADSRAVSGSTTVSHVTPHTRVVYSDGSGGTARAPGAGWGFVVVTGGDGDDDDDARELHESCGPVVCDAAAPVWLGAQRHTNNTGELTGLGESIRWLLESDPDKTQPVLLRPDSEYSVGVLTGRVDAEENAELVEQVRTLLERLRAQRKGRVGWSHVRGHSKHKWNDRADAGTDLHGREGRLIEGRRTSVLGFRVF